MTEMNSEERESIEYVSTVIPREISICALCRDDISTNLGRRRLLFHLSDQTRADPTTEVVKQMHDLLSIFANGVNGRQCDLTDCTQSFIESLSAKWCCRKCERLVSNIYKKFQQLQQFYNQFKDCPLSTLLNTLSVNNVNNEQFVSNTDSDNTITIHGVLIDETQLNQESQQLVTHNTDEIEEQKSPKKRKLDENESKESENREEETESPTIDNQRTTRSRTSARLKQTPNKDIESKKSNKKSNKSQSNEEIKRESIEENVDKNDNKSVEQKEVNSESINKIRKLDETENQILSSLYSQYYEGILRAMLSDNRLRIVAISEVGKYVSRECSTAATEVAKMSHSIETMKMPEFKKLIQYSLPSTLQLLTSITGKENLLNPPIISIVSILIYVLNSHANLFQKMMATVLLSAKCDASTIARLHSYKLCIAYETLVSFIDNNVETTQIPKLIKSFQMT